MAEGGGKEALKKGKPNNIKIEVDGLTHLDNKVIERDKIKERDLKEAVFHLIRFRDEEILNRIDLVILKIQKFIDNIGL